MKVLGIATNNGARIEMPEGFEGARRYQVIDSDGNLILVPLTYEEASDAEVERLAAEIIQEHRKTLEALS